MKDLINRLRNITFSEPLYVVAINDSQWLSDDTGLHVTKRDCPQDACKFTKDKAQELTEKVKGSIMLKWSDEWLNDKPEVTVDSDNKTFADDLSKVKAKTDLPEGTFLKKAESIKKTILENAKDKQHAIQMINFYINRAGDKLENKTEVMKAKDLIENCHEFSELTERLSKLIK